MLEIPWERRGRAQRAAPHGHAAILTPQPQGWGQPAEPPQPQGSPPLPRAKSSMWDESRNIEQSKYLLSHSLSVRDSPARSSCAS